jgi:hypothetical protein
MRGGAVVGVALTDVTSLLRVLLWPVVVLVLLLMFRRYLPDIVSGVAGRVSKVSLAGISLELVTASEVPRDPLSALGNTENPSMQVFASDRTTLLSQVLTGNVRADSAVIDLGGGDRWLTSRLLIFAFALAEGAGVKRMVFVARVGGVNNVFVGMAEPQHVREAVARQYPWLGDAFFQAVAQTNGNLNEMLKQACRHSAALNVSDLDTTHDLQALAAALPRDGSVDATLLQYVASSYLGSGLVRRSADAPRGSVEGWVGLPVRHPTYEEHARWIRDGDDLAKLLDGLNEPAPIVDSRAGSRTEVWRQALRSERTDFVAVGDDQKRFKHLIDRRALLERVAIENADPRK